MAPAAYISLMKSGVESDLGQPEVGDIPTIPLALTFCRFFVLSTAKINELLEHFLPPESTQTLSFTSIPLTSPTPYNTYW